MTRFTRGWLCRKIVEDSRDAVVFADRDGIIRLWNRGAAEMFGWGGEEAWGRPLELIIPENLQARHCEGYRRVMATGTSQYSQDLLAVPGLNREGRRLSLEFTITLVREDEGQILGAAAIIREVTARRQREQELKKRLTDLEAKLGTPEKLPPSGA
jgi:PAS domain S-box-containing protein